MRAPTPIYAGLVPYEDAWEHQRSVHARRVAGDLGDTVLLLEHPSVYTAGRRTTPAERPSDGTPVIDVDRGGKITWHGPGQLVGYPILRLDDPVDVLAYVRRVEAMLVAVCAEFGVATHRVDGRTGVWVAADRRGPERKIAAIGVRVARGVTLHGFALNCDPDLTAFDRIIPCGIADAGVTSLTAELGREVGVAEARPVVEAHLPGLIDSASTAQTDAEDTDDTQDTDDTGHGEGAGGSGDPRPNSPPLPDPRSARFRSSSHHPAGDRTGWSWRRSEYPRSGDDDGARARLDGGHPARPNRFA